MKSRSYLERRLKSLQEKLQRMLECQQPAPETVRQIIELQGRVKELKNVLEI